LEGANQVTMFATIGFTLWALVAQTRPATPAEDLAAAKSLYAQGIYEDALMKLAAIRGESTADEVDEYRALCQLALGRTAEAQRSLESLFTRAPLFKMSDTDVPPRLVTMFHDVRRRLLPAAIRTLYAKAKSNYDQKNFAPAITQFKDLLTLTNDEDLGDEAAALADLKLLGEGFLGLSVVEQEKAVAAAAAKAAAAAAAAPPPKPEPPAGEPPKTPAAAPGSAPQGPKIYTETDKDVTPPVEISKALPEWNPSNPQWRKFELSGAIRIVIDEAGKVESVTLVQSVHESYDPLLLAAARQWQFKPARKNGQPVKYQKVVAVLLAPR
jgi:TonB family protein